MKNSGFAFRHLCTALLAALAAGCVSYRTEDAVRVQDEVLEDNYALAVDVVAVAPPNLVLRLQPSGEKTIQRTTITDRSVHYDIESGLLKGIKEVGFNPPIVFVIPFGLASDLAQFVLSAPTQLPAGWWASIDPPASHSSFTTAQPTKIRPLEEVRIRFGPRMLETVRTGKENQVVVDASKAARALLAKGKTKMAVQVQLPNGDLRAAVTLSHAAMQQLASPAKPTR